MIIATLVVVELAGVLGALLAILIAGMIRVIVRDVWTTAADSSSPNPPPARTATSYVRNT